VQHLESLSREQLISRVVELEFQLKWFRNQIFGRKSERWLAAESRYIQLTLGSLLEVVLKYVRPVIKLNDKVVSHPAPTGVFDKSFADVSLIAGILIDKFQYHLPLYRQHQRLAAAGITLSRQTLTNVVAGAAELMTPIYYAQLSSILQSEGLAMGYIPGTVHELLE